MIPEYMPVFTVDHIHQGEGYEDGKGRFTSVGWLKELFLYHYLDKESLEIRPSDRKDYEKVVDKFRKISKIKEEDLHDWEDVTSRKKQAACLNKLRKALGYTVVK